MIQRYRPLLFWSFTGIFFLTASLVLFYTFGYRFNLDRGIFVYTGSITIKPNPETVVIRIDGETIPEKRLGLLNNSIHVSGLAPGEHFIEVSAPGYATWSKKTTVQSGMSTEFWNVLLAKETYSPIEIPSTEQALKLFHALEDNLLAVVKKSGTGFAVDTLDTATGETERIFSIPDATFSPEEKENLEWAPESHKLLIPLLQSGARAYSIVERESKRVTDLNALVRIESPLRAPRWDPTAKNFLFFLSGNTLYRIDTGTPAAAPTPVKTDVETYDLSGQYLYYLSSENGIVYRLPADRSSTELTQITSATASISPESDYSLITYDGDRLALLERASGTLSVLNRNKGEMPLKRLATGIRGVQFSDDGKKLLFFSDNEISVYFVRPWEAQPVREADTILQIARFSTPLRLVQWTKDYEHVLFSANGTLKFIELDNRDRRNIFDIAAFPSPLLQALSRFEENRLYLIRSDHPEGNAVESIFFPETAALFGLR